MAPDLLELAEQRQQGQQAQQGAPAADAAGSAPACTAADAPDQQEQEQEQPDVHQQALARASMDVRAEALEAARRALEEASCPGDGGEPAGAGAVQGTSVPAAQQQQAAAAPTAAGAAQAAPAPATKPQRPPKGALLDSFAGLVRQLYLPPQAASGASADAAVCATPLLRTLRAFPIAGAPLAWVAVVLVGSALAAAAAAAWPGAGLRSMLQHTSTRSYPASTHPMPPPAPLTTPCSRLF